MCAYMLVCASLLLLLTLHRRDLLIAQDTTVPALDYLANTHGEAQGTSALVRGVENGSVLQSAAVAVFRRLHIRYAYKDQSQTCCAYIYRVCACFSRTHWARMTAPFAGDFPLPSTSSHHCRPEALGCKVQAEAARGLSIMMAAAVPATRAFTLGLALGVETACVVVGREMLTSVLLKSVAH